MRLNRLIRIFVLGLFVILSVSSVGAVLRLRATREEIEKKRRELEKQEEEVGELKKVLEEVQKLEFVEKEARDGLGLAKPGETVVILPDEETLRLIAPSLPEEEEEPGEKDPVWRKWLKLFF